MTLQPIKDVSEYKRLKQTLRDRFESEKTGDQTLLEEQTKKYKPLLSSQKEIAKTLQNVASQIVESQNEGQTALQPFIASVAKHTESASSCPTSYYPHCHHMYYRRLSLHHNTPLLNQPSLTRMRGLTFLYQ